MSKDWNFLKPGRYGNHQMISIICLLGIIILLSFLASCGGGGSNVPDQTSTVKLTGTVIFMESVPLAQPPADMFDGDAPPDLRYAARIVDPGDDIGLVPLPKPANLSANGSYHFDDVNPNPLAYFNLRFIVNLDLNGDGNTQTSISLNLPVALANAFITNLAIVVNRPSDNILELTYTYTGPDGSREIRLQLNFKTDLLSFDLDSDGLFDDLIAIDYNHDAIPDAHATYMQLLDYTATEVAYGTVAGIGPNTISVNGSQYEIWGHTNINSKLDGSILAMSDISNGKNATVNYSSFNGENIAASVQLEPGPTNPSLDFKVMRSGDIEEIDATTLVAGGVLFHDYPQATIKDALGSSVDPSQLEVGTYVSVIGSRDGNVVTAEEITVTEVSPPPSYIERQGVIDALYPEDHPTTMTVSGVDFQITPQTVIRDKNGLIVDVTYLLTGSPVYVLGHEDAGALIADLIELLYVIDSTGTEPEVVILVNDQNAVNGIQGVIDQLNPELAVVPVLVSSYPPPLSAPPCTYDVFNSLFVSKPILLGIPGFIEAFPRFEAEECHVLILLDDGYPDAKAWIDYFYPNGLGEIGASDGYPILFDNVVTPPYYGAGPELIGAIQLSNDLKTLLSANDSVIDVYISPEVSFSE
jgi:hypothetical protein